MTKTHKMTDIGLIPNDWKVMTIEEVGHSFSYGVGAEAIPFDGKNKYIRITDIDDESAQYRPTPMVSPSFFSEHHILKDGDIVVARTGASVGKSYLYSNTDGKLIFAGFLMKFNVSGCNATYLAYHLRTKQYKQWVGTESARTGQPGLNIEQLKQFSFPTPSDSNEQNGIATVLANVDSLISSIEKAIIKKKMMKEGAMQQLLTGRIRLNNSTNEWIQVTFGDVISRFATGLNPRQNFTLNSGGSCNYVTIKDFKDGVLNFENCDKINQEACELINRRSDLRVGDLLFSSIGRVGDAYVIKEEATDWNINESVYNLRPRHDLITSDFLYYIIKSHEVYQKLQDAVTGSTLRSIKMNHLKAISFTIPPTIEEQLEIATILSSMDNEIQSLEAEKNKYISIKQGMMQKLLTGQIRLPQSCLKEE